MNKENATRITTIKRTRKPRTAPKLKQPYKSPITGQIVNLTDNQHQFTEAALKKTDSNVLIKRVQEIYETDRHTATVIARQNFNNPSIIQYLGDRGYRAIDVLNEAMTDEKAAWSDRIRAAQDIADRQFGKAMQRAEIKSTEFIKISLGE